MRHRISCSYLTVMLIALLGASAPVLSNTPARVALIADKAFDLHKSPLVSLLEVKLSEEPNLVLLERNEIDKVLREQQLQLMFSAGAVRERITAGKLLKADVLILLRGREENQIRQLDVIIAETDSGLRLLVRTVLWSDDPSSDIMTIYNLTTQALQKYRGGITHICAVPPFMSNDLSHQYDFLQTAYSRVVEQTLLQFTGVVVVELEEAHAIAEELMLAGSEVRVERKLPLYILGEYRNEGINDNRTTSIRLTSECGRQQLATITKENLPPGDVGSFLRQQSRELLALVAKRELPPADPQTEVKLLVERAKEFKQIANWAEALTLLEAGLLINTDQPQVHCDVIGVLFQLIRLSYDIYSSDEEFIRKARLGLDYYTLMLKHIEWIVLTDNFIEDGLDFVSGFLSRIPTFDLCHCSRSELIASDCEKKERERNELLIRIMDSKANAGELDDRIAHLLVHNYFNVPYDDSRLSIEDNYIRRLEGIELFQNLPKAREWTYRLGHDGIGVPAVLVSQGYSDFVEQIAAIPNSSVQAAVRQLREDIQHEKDLCERSKARENTVDQPEALDSRADYDVILRAIPVNTSGIWGWLPCSDKIDFVWAAKTFFLMKQRDVLKAISHSKERFYNIISPCYDGRYVWVPVTGSGASRAPSVLVVDPVTEDIIEFTADDGLPPWVMVAAVALNPGEICLAGGLRGRGWCAILRINESGERLVDVFHEARENIVEDKPGRKAEMNPYLAFSPKYMKVVSAPQDASKQRVLLGRGMPHWEAGLHPLVIDPQMRSVDVLPDFVGRHLLGYFFTSHEGSLYWAARNVGAESHPSLWCISFETLRTTGVATPVPEDGFVVFANGAVHIVGEQWWTAKGFSDDFTRLKVRFPPGAWYHRRICQSNHYGLVMLADKRPYSIDFNSVSINGSTYQESKKAAVAEE